MYGLIGKKLSHSFSPQIHKELASYDYKLFEIEENQLESFIKTADFNGLNVTIPYKKAVIPYLTEISETAQKIGSVNTIIKRADGSLYGENTDYYGFMYTIKSSKIVIENKKCLVLGSGGASLTVTSVLKDLNAKETIIISRSGKDNYKNITKHSDAEIIINTTPVGMYPNCGKAPVNLKLFPNCKAVFDLIYNPFKTKLLLEAEDLNIPGFNGLKMLTAQAKKACELFTDTEIPDSKTEEIKLKLQKQLMNIVLIGMPGCGKSTVGKIISEKLYRDFIDTDSLIEKSYGKKIPEIFSEKGEAFFRDLEEKEVYSAGKENSKVIATGGGAILRKENIHSLRQNAVIVFINRKLDYLETKGRPLSSDNKNLEQIYTARLPVYKAIADLEVNSQSTAEQTADLIIKELKI